MLTRLLTSLLPLLLTIPAARAEPKDPIPLIRITPDGPVKAEKLLDGQFVLVAVFTVWCKPCVKEIPTLRKLAEEFADKGIRVVGLSMDEAPPAQVARWVTRHQVTYPVFYADSRVRRGHTPLGRITMFPTTILVSQQGKALRRWLGVLPERVLRAALAPLVEKPARKKP